MKLNKHTFFVLIFFMIVNCGGGGGGGSTNPTAVTLTSIEITPANPSIPRNATRQFTATGTYSDSSTQDITTSVTWSSSNTAVATIGSATGLSIAVAAGSTTITASSGSVSGSTTMTVTSATITSIDITPANPGIGLGATQQFTATGNYSDSTTQDITTLVTWSSSNTAVATIGNKSVSNGLAASLAAGTTTITADWAGASESTQLTVNATPLANVIPITVNGSLCSSNSYPNKPCVSVTVCSPGTSICQTINDILLDTGACGLHIFKSVLTDVVLPPVASGSGSLTKCVQFADGSAQWGPVQTADIILGGEPAVRVPIHVIDPTFGTVPASCGEPETSPEKAGFNGILGVGLVAEDCGSDCENDENNRRYYSCGSDSTCTGTTVLIANQVTNPVSLLPVDNNGVLLRLPSVPLDGAVSVNGVLILGIGTQSNNTPSGVTAYHANSDLYFTTVFNGVSYSNSFIDSGSNGLFFDARRMSTLPTWGDWFNPSTVQNLSAITKDYAGSPSSTVPFQIGDAEVLLSSSNPNYVFIELGGQYDSSFDWGLPFFLGRNVFVGIGGKASSLGTGPYWAY